MASWVYRLIFVSVFALTVPFISPAAAATPAEAAFAQGHRAFRDGDLAAALASFERARRLGMDTPGLRYNLGVTYYRLRRYPDAQREFERLTRDPAWAPVAHYNLGLTAQRLGREPEAAEHFDRAYRTGTDPKLRALAATALERLGRAPPAAPTSAYVSLAGGFDSNVTLAPDAETVGLGDDSDFFVEGIFAASHRLHGTPARGVYVHGGLHVREYFDAGEFSQYGARAGLSRDADSGGWRTGVGGYLDLIYVDGRRFERAATLDLQARRDRGGGRDLRLRNQLGRIDGGGGFGYLDGWQNRLTVDAGFPTARARMRAGYQLELNDRADLVQGAEFFSYSPTRHSLFASVAWPAGGWQWSARGEYRASRYNDPHRLNGGASVVTREDDRYLAALRAERRITGPWRLFLDYGYYRNDSNLRAYDYNRHLFTAGVESSL